MVSLGTALNTALQSLEANQFALSVASNNIGNANTPGYTRQRTIFQELPGPNEPLATGGGVEVNGSEALRDRLITLRLWQETSQKSESDSTGLALGDIETSFNDSGNTGLIPLLTNFYTSFHALSTNPSDLTLRQVVKENAGAMIDYFHSHDDQLRTAQHRLNDSVDQDVNEINSLATRIAALTAEINNQETQHPANELRDQRENLVQQLSRIVEVHEFDSKGSYQLSIGSGRPLVFDSTSMPLTVAPSATTGFLTIQSGNDDITSEISGGQLAAHLAVRDQFIPQYQQAFDQLAFDIAQQVNTIHETGYDLDGNTGVPFFAPPAGVSGAAYSLALSSDISSSTRKIAASRSSTGVDNEIAIEIGNSMNVPASSGVSIVDQYRNLIFSIGNDTATANTSGKTHQAMLQQLQNRRDAVSGVSIDEETVQMMQFQRSYQASARLVTTIDELLQTVLGMGAR